MRAKDTHFLVDGMPLLAADAGVELGFSDLDSEASGRDESGYLHRDVLRKAVRTWDFTYGVLTAEEFDYLQSLFAGKATFRFREGDYECSAYCSKSSVRLWDRARGIYRDLRFTVIAC